MSPLSRLCCLLFLTLAATFPLRANNSDEVQPWKYLTVEEATSAQSGWKTVLTNHSVTGGDITINLIKYGHGLGAHAPSEVVYNLDGKRKKFSAEVGIDDRGGDPGSAVFKVMLDGREAYNSGVIKWHEDAKQVALDLTGVKEMRLVTEQGGASPQGDHTDWAEAKVDDQVVAKPVPHFSTAGFFAVDGAARTVANFNPGWRFHKGNNILH